MRQSFGRNERLKSRKVIEKLYTGGNRITVFPLRVYFLPSTDRAGSQVAFSVPKRRLGKAVERNLIKRRMREAYRLNRAALSAKKQSYQLLLVYIGEGRGTFAQIERALQKVIKEL